MINENILYHFVRYKFLVSGIKWGFKRVWFIVSD